MKLAAADGTTIVPSVVYFLIAKIVALLLIGIV
jgi:hypothetical protein